MPFDVTPEEEPAEPGGSPRDPIVPAPESPQATFAPEEAAAPRWSPVPRQDSLAGSAAPFGSSPTAPPVVPPPAGPWAGAGRPSAGDYTSPVYTPRPQRRRGIGLLVSVLVGMLVIGGIGAGLAAYGGSGSSDTGPGHVYRIGEPADLGSLTFTVLEVRALPTADYFEPKEGFMSIAVHVEAVNDGERTKVVSSLAQFSVRDSTGLTYEQTIADGLVGSIDGILPPGSKLRGEVAFEVPAGMTGLQLVISDFIFAGSVTVQLT